MGAVALFWKVWRYYQDRKEKNSERFMGRAFDLFKRAYQEMHESHREFRHEEGGKTKVTMAPKRDAALWRKVAEMLQEACLLHTSVTEATHKQTYDAEIRYWRLNFSEMLLRRGFPRLYYGDADVMTKGAFYIQERYLVPIYRFAAVSTDIARVQEVQFDDNELLGFVMGKLPGLHKYIQDLRRA